MSVTNNRSVLGWLITTFALVFMAGTTGALAQTAFQDDFNGATLGSGWTTRDGYKIQNPADTAHHAAFQMTGSQLSIAIPGGKEHNMWWLQHATALRTYPGSGRYEIKVDTTFSGDQQFGLVFQKDPTNFLIFMLYSYTGNTVKGYVERFSNVGDGTQYKETFDGGHLGVAMPAAGPFYIRVIVEDNPLPEDRRWQFLWSSNGTTWQPLVSGYLEEYWAHGNIGAIQSVGVFAGNQPTNFSANNAKFDRFNFYPDGTSQPVDAPSGVVSRAGDHRADVWWQAMSGVSSYRLYGGSTAGGPYSLVGTTSQTSLSQLNLTNNVARYYVVKAVVNGVEGSASREVKAVPHTSLDLAMLPADGLTLALSASELAYSLSNGAAVDYWPNARGPQISAAAPLQRNPTLVTSALNGKPAVRFDGSDDYLTLPSGFNDFTNGMSLYIVAKPSALQSGFKLFALGNGAGQQNIGLGRNGSAAGYQYFVDSASGVSWFNTDDGLVAGQASLVSVLQEAGAPNQLAFAEVAKNAVPLFGQNVRVPPVAARGTNYIGKSFWNEGMFQGDIAEIVLYNRKLNSSEQSLVLDYIENKYGLGITGNPTTPPIEAPAQLTATAGNSTVQLSWTTTAQAVGYRLYRATGTSQTFAQIADVTTLNYTDSTVTNGITYRYKVSAYSATEESPQSAAITAKPVGNPVPSPLLPTGMMLLLDAGTAAQQYDAGQPVTIWRDASGNNLNANAGTDAPTLVASSINGKPALRFDGNNDFLTLPAGFQNFTAGMSVYIVSRPTSLQSGFKLLALGNGADQQNIGIGRAGSTGGYQVWNQNGSGSVRWFDTSYGLTVNEASLLTLTQTGGTQNGDSTAQLFKNGMLLHSATLYVPPVANRATNYIGKSYWNEGMFQGDIAEILIYNRTLNLVEQLAVRNYISQKYALVLP